jgi:hypothetical protein
METLGKEKLSRFIEDNLISFPVAPRTEEEHEVGPIPGLPTTYLIGPDGKLVARQVGQISGDELESFIAEFGKSAGS